MGDRYSFNIIFLRMLRNNEYQWALAFLLEYLFNEEMSRIYPLGEPNKITWLEFLESNVCKNSSIMLIKEKLTKINKNILSKVFEEILSVITKSKEYISKESVTHINAFFNQYKEENPEIRIIEENKIWYVYYHRMKELENWAEEAKKILNEEYRIHLLPCEIIKEYLLPNEYKLYDGELPRL